MKVTVLAIIATPTRDQGCTMRTVGALEKSLRTKCDPDFEYLFLEDLNLSRCQGHLTCSKFGEHKGPFISSAAEDAAETLVAAVRSGGIPRPGLAELINFRVWRSVVTRTENASPYDWAHWQKSGWLNQDYYFSVQANVVANGIA